jgi:hypothetical protein
MELLLLIFLVHYFSTLFCIFSAWPFSNKAIKELNGPRKQGRHGHGVKLLKLLTLVRVWRNLSGVMLFTLAIRLSNVLCFTDPFLCACDRLPQLELQREPPRALLVAVSNSFSREKQVQDRQLFVEKDLSEAGN